MSTPATAEALPASPPAASRLRPHAWWRRLAALGESTPASVGVVIVLAWVPLALLAPLIAPYPPNANDMAALAHTTPSTAHWLATDQLGRDRFSAIRWGARPVLIIAPLAARGPLVVDMCLRTGYNVIIIGSLGFLGIGLPPPDPDWGGMVKDTYGMMMVWPHMALFPCAAISSLVVGFNLLAVGLRELGLRD